ncbi:MAG TPA: lysophospholipid acyltransferase family protein [Candidatus Dormibacteraeota bacterium]|jgi:1-acyl-sn-glycerol-3-phosphate acyltransferase|nr:lysophospholipid acyltransferase family protein [Candidatus Dormibacteraeota bacterium]
MSFDPLGDLEQVRRGFRWGETRPSTWAPAAPAVPEPATDLAWARTEPALTARKLIQRGVSMPFTELMARPHVSGREWLDQLDRSAIIVSNHVSHADTQLLLYALTDRVRERTVVSAADDYWYQEHPWVGRMVSLWLNTFPFSRTGKPQTVLANSGMFLQSGWHLLIYAEGTRSPDGRMGPFRPGVGYLATQNRAPVVPIHLRGTDRIMARGRSIPMPAPARVRIGKPLVAAPKEDYRAFTRRIEDAVRTLAQGPPDDAVRGTWVERWRASSPGARGRR